MSASVHAGIPPPSGSRPPGADTTPPGRDGHCCGRHASYWNAFLFVIVLLKITLSTENCLYFGQTEMQKIDHCDIK